MPPTKKDNGEYTPRAWIDAFSGFTVFLEDEDRKPKEWTWASGNERTSSL